MLDVRQVEEISLNQWPAISTLVYDGWLLRFADGYTKRSNSIQPLYTSTIDVDTKIEACEQLYTAQGLDTIYKITPLVQPKTLDQRLEERGYRKQDPVSVQVRSLAMTGEFAELTIEQVTMEERFTDSWIEDFCRLSRIDDRYQRPMRQLLNNIKTPTCFLSIREQDQAVACGLGVLEREILGIYDLVTDTRFRNRGYGEQAVKSLWQWGKKEGAKHSYLAVLLDNHPALRLYAKLGYQELYQYWFRVKPFQQASLPE